MDEQGPPTERRTRDGETAPERRDRKADERDVALDAREDSLRARETADAHRDQAAQAILDDANERDELADERDELADARDKAASLHSFIHDEDGSSGMKARRSAGLDRSDAKADRALAAEDRSKLSGGTPAETEDVEG
jgi:hypothetical protein